MTQLDLGIIVFIAAAVIALLASLTKLPATPALLALGLGLGAIHSLPAITLSAHVILYVFLPPLLFEAAFALDLSLLWQSRRGVLVLALPGVALATIVGAGVVHFGLSMPWPVALLFGAIISATDPVAVLATFRALGADRRLSVLLEGESLLNDGVALVLVAALADAVGGSLRAPHLAGQFVFTLAGGVVAGAVVGAVGHRLIALTSEHLVEMSLSIAVAYGAFIAGESVHVSAVFATLTAAVVLGQLERTRKDAFSVDFERLMHDLWTLLTYVANALLFVLMGMAMHVSVFRDHKGAAVWAIAAALVGRAASVYGLNRFGFPLSSGERHVLFWGGLRGAVALAAVLSLRDDLPYRERLLEMTFAVVIFTVIVQGLSVGPLVRRLDLLHRP